MLADEILAMDDRIFREVMRPLHWKDAMRRAARFDMVREVVLSAHVLQRQPLQSRLKALSLARVPFQTTWFEWPGIPYQIRTDGVRSTDQARNFAAPTPRRMGALIETDETSHRVSRHD